MILLQTFLSEQKFRFLILSNVSFYKQREMSLFILITLQLFLGVKVQGLPQAKLTVLPRLVHNGEMVHMVCGGYENRTVPECMFYPLGQENFTMPKESCNLHLNSTELIMWSKDQQSSHVNVVCYYAAIELGKYVTSPHSNNVSVEVRANILASSHLATTSSVSEVTDFRSTMLFSSETSQDLSTMSTPSTVQMTTYMSSLITHNSHFLTDSTNAFLESTTSIKEQTTSEGPKIKKYSNITMLLFIVVIASGGGLLLIGLIGICIYGCRRRQRTERIWIESVSKEQAGVSLPMVGSDSCCVEDEEFYSTVNILPSTSEPSGNSNEQSNQTKVELNPLYYTILTQPAISDSCDIYSVPMTG